MAGNSGSRSPEVSDWNPLGSLANALEWGKPSHSRTMESVQKGLDGRCPTQCSKLAPEYAGESTPRMIHNTNACRRILSFHRVGFRFAEQETQGEPDQEDAGANNRRRGGDLFEGVALAHGGDEIGGHVGR